MTDQYRTARISTERAERLRLAQSSPGAAMMRGAGVTTWRRLAGILLASSILFLPILGCNREDPKERFNRLIGEAKTFSDQQKYEEARLKIQSAIDAQPQNAEGYFELGDVFFKMKRGAQAEENYRTAVNYNPKHRMAHYRLATLYLMGKYYEQAEDHINTLLELDPNDIEARILRANMLASLPKKNLKEAYSILDDILAKDPNNVSALGSKAGLYLGEGKLKEAEELFLKALKIDKENGPLLMILAELYARQGRLDEAQDVVENLVKKFPDNTGLRFSLGEFLLKRGFGEEAANHYREVLKSKPLQHEARDRLYDLMVTRKEPDKATELVKELAATNPDDPGVFYFNGRELERQGKPKEALEQFLKGIPGLGSFAPIFRRAGLIELILGQGRTGLEHLNQAVAIDPGDIGARLALAQQALNNKDVALATEHVTQVLQRFPQQLGANILRADIAVIEGKPEDARKVYQYLIENFPQNPSGYLKLALLEERAKNFDRAIELYKKVLEFDVPNSVPIERLAQLEVGQQGFDRTIVLVKQLAEKADRAKPEIQYVLAGLTMANTADPQRMPKARALLEKVVEARPSLIGAYLMLGSIDGQEGNLDAAASTYEKLLAQNPRHIPTLMLVGLVRERQGRSADAESTYRKILEIDPTFGPAANNLAWILAARDKADLDEALKLAQLARERMPEESSVADTLGWVYFKRGTPELALPFIESGVAQERKARPNQRPNPEILYHLAEVQAALNNKPAAAAAAQEALQTLGNNHSLSPRLQELAAASQ